jgi:hypothetical protein
MAMDPSDHLAQWVVTENIARFEEKLKTETDSSQRKLLENLLSLERKKLTQGPHSIAGSD